MANLTNVDVDSVDEMVNNVVYIGDDLNNTLHLRRDDLLNLHQPGSISVEIPSTYKGVRLYIYEYNSGKTWVNLKWLDSNGDETYMNEFDNKWGQKPVNAKIIKKIDFLLQTNLTFNDVCYLMKINYAVGKASFDFGYQYLQSTQDWKLFAEFRTIGSSASTQTQLDNQKIIYNDIIDSIQEDINTIDNNLGTVENQIAAIDSGLDGSFLAG